MNFNNKVIEKNKKISFLLCEKKLIKYYNKYDWVKLDKNKYHVVDYNIDKIGMVFNHKKNNSKKLIYFWIK